MKHKGISDDSMKTRFIPGHGVTAIVVLLIAGAFLAAGCAGDGRSQSDRAGEPDRAEASEIPDWYLNPSGRYPDDRYMTAVGSGTTRRAAEEQAFAGLSQAFELDIAVDTRTQERYREIMSDGGTAVESEIELSQALNVRSAQQLLNVQTAEATVDSQGTFRTIAYIERMPTGRIYADLIRQNDARVSSFLSEAESSSDPVRHYAYLNSALAVAQSNEVLLEQLRIISPPVRRSVSVSYDYTDILRARADAAEQIRVALHVEGDSGGRLASTLREAVSDQRFVIASERPLLELFAQVEVEPIDLNPNFESVRWVMDLDFRRAGGESIVSLGESGRASGTTVERAQALAYSDIQNMLAFDFTERLSGYFDSIVLGD